MPTVLVVDDSVVDRRLIGALLKADGDLDVLYSVDGARGLEVIRSVRPDLVVTDLMMPEVDGLTLVKTVRAECPTVPVIMVTSQGSEETAVQALHEGAASYVPKHRLADTLLETVRGVLAVSSKRRRHLRLLRRMRKLEYTVVLDNDPTLVSPLVEYVQDGVMQMRLCDEAECTRIGVAVREALLNALYHGNLEVGSELREGGDSRSYHALARRRMKQAPYRDRRIVVESRLSPSEAVFVVADEGSGFDPNAAPDPRDPANLEKLGGRGLLLMRTLMDEVVYNDIGNRVTLTKRCCRER